MSDSTFTYEQIAKMIDHALLAPTLTRADYAAGLDMAAAYGVASVCISPWFVAEASERLSGTGVLPSTVIGFPHGVHTTASKVAEAERALADGAVELDMVCNIPAVRSGDWPIAKADIAAVTDVVRSVDRAKIKVIFECCYLDDDQKKRLCDICGEAGVDWVKTSTGFGTGGATDDDLRLMRANSPETVAVKASGGIKTLERLLAAREIGCTRVGASATPTILDEVRSRLGLAPIDAVVEAKPSAY